jgi:hypothetical protein
LVISFHLADFQVSPNSLEQGKSARSAYCLLQKCIDAPLRRKQENSVTILKSALGQIPFRQIALHSFYPNRGFASITSDKTNILPTGAKLVTMDLPTGPGAPVMR